MSLPLADIARLATRAGADRVAVENFLCSLDAHDASTFHEAYENARADARSYRWNEATLGAIVDGIALAQQQHSCDAHCTVGADGCCIGCGVSHTHACAKCGGRGFHTATCPEVRPAGVRCPCCRDAEGCDACDGSGRVLACYECDAPFTSEEELRATPRDRFVCARCFREIVVQPTHPGAPLRELAPDAYLEGAEPERGGGILHAPAYLIVEIAARLGFKATPRPRGDRPFSTLYFTAAKCRRIPAVLAEFRLAR